MLWQAIHLISVSLFLHVQAIEQFVFPAALPLAVRSPYLSAWLISTNGSGSLQGGWPSFWNNLNDPILGWTGHIRIDGQPYKWFGDESETYPSANVTSIQVTATRTVFELQAGPVNLLATFLNPVEPADWVKQSLPFTYLALEVTSRDGQPHSVAVYSDISGEWLSGNRSAIMTFNTTQTSAGNYFHMLQLESPASLTEIAEQAEDVTVYFAMSSSFSPTYMLNEDTYCRGEFDTDGTLPDQGLADNTHSISQPWYPVFAFSADLGNITNTSAPVFWALGMTRDPVVQYTNSSGGTEMRSPLWRTQYDSAGDMIDDVLADFTDALSRAEALDQNITQAASGISEEYAAIASYVVHQAFSSIEITVGNAADGGFNTSDVKIFMRDMGNARRVNPVEVLYASLPVFLYMNASFVKPLLAPLLEYQESPQFTLPYAARDLGSEYPIATGDAQAHQQGVEQSGNMLIMALAHARLTGDGSLLGVHYTLLKGWGEYLVNNTQDLSNQVSADEQQAANMSNLAIKGIIALQAMSEISSAVGETEDAQSFASTAATYAAQWQALYLSGGQTYLPFALGSTGSWVLAYNLYSDLLLGAGVVSRSVYQDQCSFYETLSTPTYGLQIDSATATLGNAAWLSFTAATCSNATQRDYLLSMVSKRANYNLSSGIFPETYLVDTGAQSGGVASGGMGAIFAPLALSMKNVTIIVPPPSSSSALAVSSSKPNGGAIAGGVIGALLGLGTIGYFLWRRRRLGFPGKSALEPFTFRTQGRDETLPLHFERTSVPTASILNSQEGLSEKTRQLLEAAELSRDPVSRTEGTSTTSSSTAPASVEPPSVVEASISDVANLRTEVENLRRVMQDLRVESLEPPPEYAV